MKKIFIVVLFAIVGLCTTNLQAQNKQYYNIGWGIGMPIGGFSDYIGDTSLRGGSLSGNVFLTNSFSIGFKFGYNSYHENIDRQTYQMGKGVAVTAASYNYLVTAPMTVGGYYHIDLGSVEPYFGLGLGLNYITTETLVQDYSDYKYDWAFTLNPEIGLRIPIQNTPLAFRVHVGYNVSFNSYEVWNHKYENFQSLEAGISLGYTIQ